MVTKRTERFAHPQCSEWGARDYKRRAGGIKTLRDRHPATSARRAAGWCRVAAANRARRPAGLGACADWTSNWARSRFATRAIGAGVALNTLTSACSARAPRRAAGRRARRPSWSLRRAAALDGIGRQIELAAFGQQFACVAGVVVALQVTEQRMVGKRRLDQHAARLVARPARPATCISWANRRSVARKSGL